MLFTAERLLVLEGPEAPQDRLAYTLNFVAQAANGRPAAEPIAPVA